MIFGLKSNGWEAPGAPNFRCSHSTRYLPGGAWLDTANRGILRSDRVGLRVHSGWWSSPALEVVVDVGSDRGGRVGRSSGAGRWWLCGSSESLIPAGLKAAMLPPVDAVHLVGGVARVFTRHFSSGLREKPQI